MYAFSNKDKLNKNIETNYISKEIKCAQTEWVIPTEFPDLRQVDEIAIDLETKDPDLIKKGSGSIIGNGEVIGIAVATTHYKGYFPIAHEGGGNMDRKKVLEWFQDIS